MELNKIYNENYKSGIEKIPDKSIDLIVTDPPYLHVKGGMKSKTFNKGKVWSKGSHMTSKMSDFGREEIFTFLDIALQKLKKANMYIFCSKLQLVFYFEYLSKHKKLKYDLLVWDKQVKSMKSSKFHTSDIEYIIRIYEPGVSLYKVWNKEGTKSDVSHYLKLQSYKQPKGSHTTMKPIDLIENLIRVSSQENDIVLDTFNGSGTTSIACLNTNRNYIGFELDEGYYKASLNRIEEHKKE